MTEPTRDDELRKTRLTGSTMAAYLGFSPWDSPLSAWEVAQGITEFLGNDDTEAGSDMEDGILKNTMRKLQITGLDIIERDPKVDPDPIAWMAEHAGEALKPGTLVHPQYPEVFAVTPDLVVPSHFTGIQAKNHVFWASKRYRGKPQRPGGPRWDNVLIPKETLIQCLLELEVVSKILGPKGWEMWFLAANFGGSDIRPYWIRKDSRTIRALLDAGDKWWLRHLCPQGPREPPSPDCDCGGCGHGARWWVGPQKIPEKKIKLTPREKASAPIPFSDEPEDLFKTPFTVE